VYYKQVNILGSRMGYPDEFEAMLDAVGNGLRPAPIAASFGISHMADGLEYLDRRDRPGKVILTNDL
jgi:hypothetical protein